MAEAKDRMSRVIRDNLLKRSEKLGLSQTDLARRTGMTRQTVCHYFSGARFSSIMTLYTFAKALGCGIDDLLEDYDDKTNN